MKFATLCLLGLTSTRQDGSFVFSSNAGSTVLPSNMGGLCRKCWSCATDAGQRSRPQYLLWICTRGEEVLPTTSLWSISSWDCDHVTRCWGGGECPETVHIWLGDGTLAGCPLPAFYRGSFDWTRSWFELTRWVWSHGSLSSYRQLTSRPCSAPGSGGHSINLSRHAHILLRWKIIQT